MFGSKKSAAHKANTQPEKSEMENQGANPLFFSNPHVITLDRHAQAKVRSNIPLEFARSTNSIPLTLADIPEAAKYYPIAFTEGDAPLPVAIVGLEQENYFLTDKGNWLEGCYVPAYVRKYPFVFMEMPENDQLTLCVEETSLAFDAEADGLALYEDGKPSPLTKNALEFCAAYQQQHRLTREFCDVLNEKDMLSPQRSNIELVGGRKITMGGFRLIDTEKFTKLSESEVFDWYKKGFMALSYYALQSNSNWRNLLELANIKET